MEQIEVCQVGEKFDPSSSCFVNSTQEAALAFC